MNPLTLLAGSLVAVVALALVARLLGLGGGTIAGEAEAMAEAEALLSGFEAARAVVAQDGRAALVHGRDGSAALLKFHGAHIAARRIDRVRASHCADGLVIESGDRSFGRVTLAGIERI